MYRSHCPEREKILSNGARLGAKREEQRQLRSGPPWPPIYARGQENGTNTSTPIQGSVALRERKECQFPRKPHFEQQAGGGDRRVQFNPLPTSHKGFHHPRSSSK